MKIYQFPEITVPKSVRQDNALNNAAGEYKSYFSRNEGGADVLNISPEARKRFETERAAREERGILSKTAEKYAEVLRKIIDFKDGDLRGLYRSEKINQIKNQMEEGRFNFESEAMLNTTAVKLLTHLLG